MGGMRGTAREDDQTFDVGVPHAPRRQGRARQLQRWAFLRHPAEVGGKGPRDFLTLDYETYYGDDYTLSQMTTESYVRDPRFEVILASIQVNDSPAFWLLPER